MIFKVLTIVSLLLFSTSSLAQTEPQVVAREAFTAQIEGDYERLSLSYDASVVSFFSTLATKLIESSKTYPSDKAMLEEMFGTSDPAKIGSMSANSIFARMFSHIFSSKLSPEEQELMRNATFEYINTTYPDSALAEVSYVVAFTEDAKTKPKTMLLKSVDGNWRITIKPELLNAIKAAFDAPAK